MLQVRYNAFETNSSSVHTFYIKDDFKAEPFDKPKQLVATLNNYGSEWGKYENVWFISYVWSALNTYDIEEKIRNEYKKRIENLLKPYNVTVEWSTSVENLDDENLEDETIPLVSCVDLFFPILDELLDNPELFLSAALCDQSSFYTANDDRYHNINEDCSALGKLDGFRCFTKGNL
jgi:hypothetical protein